MRKLLTATLAAIGCFALLPLAAHAAPLITGLGGTSGFGQLAMGRNDDGSSAVIQMGSGFPYGIKLFSGSYNTLYINNNGNITFRGALGTYTPSPFPITNLPMLAAWWGDVDTRGGTADPAQNNVYYSTAVPGKFIVTWNYVGYYSGATNKLNSFQIILTDRSDVGQGDFDIEYRYEQLQWTTGSASGGSNGLGGTPAQMGYDAGDGKNFYRHPDSSTAAILQLVDSSNAGQPGVWRFEVRGGTPTPPRTPNLVNVHLTETLNASDITLDMASFQTAPTSVTSANGQTRIEWEFPSFPADLTKDLSFDVMFRNPVPGERRQLVARLELQYKDVNGNPVRSELGQEFITVYPSVFQVAPSSDKPVYGPGETVLISNLVKNLGVAEGSGAVRVTVLDANNAAVAVAGVTAADAIAAGGSKLFPNLQFLTASLYAGSYTLLAELVDGAGRVQATGRQSFSVAAAPGPQAEVRVATDKPAYNPNETVRVSDHVRNLLGNASLDGVTLRTTLLNADGTARAGKSEALAQLPAGGSRELAYAFPLGAAVPGDYSVLLELLRADGSVMAQASAGFKVASSAENAAGVTGVLSASPSAPNAGQTVRLSFTATNGGNASLANLPLTLSIVEPDTERVVARFTYAATLAVGAGYSGSAEWKAAGGDSGRLAAVLSAAVGGKDLVLAQAPLTVYTLEASQELRAAGRVLGMVSCDVEQSGANCSSERAAIMDKALDDAGLAHTIAGDADAFRRAFRSGQYNIYWVSGKQDKLQGTLASELREAVFAGDGILIDGEHDQRNKDLDALAGVRWRGKFGPTNLAVDLGGSMGLTGRLLTSGRSDRMDLTGGAAQGLLDAGGKKDQTPAIVSNGYGAGKALQYAFDLPASLQAVPEWQGVLTGSMQYLLPALQATLTPGALLPVRLAVSNRGPATAIAVESVLPSGSTYADADPQPRYDAELHALAWQQPLAVQQQWKGAFGLQLPQEAGNFTLRTVVSTMDEATGTRNPYGAPLQQQFVVVSASASANNAIDALNAMASLSRQDDRLRDQMVEDIRAALAAFQLNTPAGYESAIGKLVGVADALPGLTTVDTRAAHDAMGRVLREAQWRWSLAQ